jgi:hypothetical protein
MLPREREQQPDRVLGRRDHGRLRARSRRRSRAASPASTSTLSTPTPRAADHLQPSALRDQVGGQLRRRADDDRVVAADRSREVDVAVDVDVEALAQELDAGVGDRLADEDARGHTGGALERLERARDRDPRSIVARRLGEPSSTAASAVVTSKMS